MMQQMFLGFGAGKYIGNIAVTYQQSPYISVYPWSSADGFGTKYSNPSTLPTGSGEGVAFSSDKTFIAIFHNNSPYISVYPWDSGSGFGTKYSNPGGISGDATGVAFSPA